MIFHEMDLQTWNRREHFAHYTSQVPCFYSMCVDVDVTQLKKRGGAAVSRPVVWAVRCGQPASGISHGL